MYGLFLDLPLKWVRGNAPVTSLWEAQSLPTNAICYVNIYKCLQTNIVKSVSPIKSRFRQVWHGTNHSRKSMYFGEGMMPSGNRCLLYGKKSIKDKVVENLHSKFQGYLSPKTITSLHINSPFSIYRLMLDHPPLNTIWKGNSLVDIGPKWA